MLTINSNFTVHNIEGASKELIQALNKIKLELDENYINGYIYRHFNPVRFRK